MNIKIILVLLLLATAGVVGYFLTQPKPVSTPTPLNTSQSTSTPQTTGKISTQPTFKLGTTTLVTATLHIDEQSLVSTMTYSTLTGTANVPTVSIVIYDSQGRGLAGSADIPVENGRWSYASPVALTSGIYTVALFGGKVKTSAALIVKTP